MQKKKRGQALIEYVLALGLAAGVAVSVGNIAKRGIRTLWYRMAADIAAPCPMSMGCVKPEAIPDP